MEHRNQDPLQAMVLDAGAGEGEEADLSTDGAWVMSRDQP